MKAQVLSIQNQMTANLVPLETKNQIKMARLKPVKDFIKFLLSAIAIVIVLKKVTTVTNKISKKEKEAKFEIKENNPIDMPEITEWKPNQEVESTVVSITSSKISKTMCKRSSKRK